MRRKGHVGYCVTAINDVDTAYLGHLFGVHISFE